jgi:hypothetical protein
MPRKLRNLVIDRVDLVDKGANQEAAIVLAKRLVTKGSPSVGDVHVDVPLGGEEADDRDEYEKATLDAASRNSLPDSAFAAVWTGTDGKKVRKLPYKHADGSIDRGHLTAALGRLNQTEGMPAEIKAKARRKLEAAGHVDKEADDGSDSGAAGAKHGHKGAGYGHLGARHGHLGAEHGHLGARHGRLGAEHGPKGAEHGSKGSEYGRLGAKYGDLGAKHGSRKEKIHSMTKTLLQKMLDLFKETDTAKRDAGITLLSKEVSDMPVDKAHDPDDPECDCPACEKEKAMPPALAAAIEEDRKKRDTHVNKRLTDLQKQLDDAEARAVKAEKDAATASVVAKAEHDARADRDMVDVLKSFKATPFNIDVAKEDNDIRKFRKMQELDPDGFKRTMEIMKAADEQLAASNAYNNFGSSRSGGSGDAWAQIEQLASEMVTKSATPMTKEQAIDKVMDQNPKLVKEYRQGQQ